MLISLHHVFPKLVAFGLVGSVGTAAHYSTLLILVELAGVDPVVATTLGFAVGATVNYILNHRFTFKSNKSHLDAGPKFFTISIATGLLNTLLVHIGIHSVGLYYLVAQVTATSVVFLANFSLNSIWTFREPGAT